MVSNTKSLRKNWRVIPRVIRRDAAGYKGPARGWMRQQCTGTCIFVSQKTPINSGYAASVKVKLIVPLKTKINPNSTRGIEPADIGGNTEPDPLRLELTHSCV